MSRNSSDRWCLSPDTNGGNPTVIVKHYQHPSSMSSKKHGGGAWASRLVSGDSQLSRSSLQFLRRLGGKTVRVLRLVSSQRPSRKVSSLVRSRSLVDQTESHRAEAIEDCIEFLNSYSSLHRSSSVSLSTC